MINGNIEVCLYSLILSDSLLNSPVGKVQIEISLFRCGSPCCCCIAVVRTGGPRTNTTTAQYIFVYAATTCVYSHCTSSAVTTDSKCVFDLIVLHPAAVVTVKYPSKANPGATQPISITCCIQLRRQPGARIYMFYTL